MESLGGGVDAAGGASVLAVELGVCLEEGSLDVLGVGERLLLLLQPLLFVGLQVELADLVVLESEVILVFLVVFDLLLQLFQPACCGMVFPECLAVGSLLTGVLGDDVDHIELEILFL